MLYDMPLLCHIDDFIDQAALPARTYENAEIDPATHI